VFTEISAVNGIEQGIAISSTVALLGLLIFTRNILVSLLAAICLIINIVMVLAVYWLMGWMLGAIEAISITILVGLSVDYLFHIADAYCNAKGISKPLTRAERLTQSLAEMGMSVLSGAITTIASGVMLVFCTIQIFFKFGVIISSSIAISLVIALFLFSALLAAFGPVGDVGDLGVYAMMFYRKVLKRLWAKISSRSYSKVSNAKVMP